MPKLRIRDLALLGLLTLLGGTAVQAATGLSNIPGHARRPQLAYANGVLHAVDFEAQSVVYYRSTDRGLSWSRKVLSAMSTDWNPVLAARGNAVYVAWWSDQPARGTFEVYFARSVNNGASFEAPQLLSAADRRHSYVTGIDASANGQTVVVSYWDLRPVGAVQHSNLFVRVSTAAGAAGTWSAEILASDPNRILDFQNPTARLLANGRVGVIYQSDPKGLPQGGMPPLDILFTTNREGGSFYTEPNYVSTPRPSVLASKSYPNLLVDAAGVLHAAWWEARGGRNVFYSRSADHGLTWSTPVQLSRHLPHESLGTSSPTGRPAIVAIGPRIEVYWSRPERTLDPGDGAGAMLRSISSDAGASFEPPSAVLGGATTFPSAATDGTTVFVAYSADRGDGRQALFVERFPTVSLPVPATGFLGGTALLLAGLLVGLARATRRRGAAAVRTTATACAVVLALGSATAQAQQKLPLAGGNVNDLYRTGSGVLLAATDGGGIYRSTDQGASWHPADAGLGDPFVHSLHGDGREALLAGTESGVFHSLDGGASWSERIRARVSHVRMTPGNPSLCFAATLGGGVLRSVDGGLSWSAAGTAGLESLEVTALDVGGGRVWAGTNGKGVHVSHDGGLTWQRRTNGLAGAADASYVSLLQVDPQDANIVYLGSQGDLAPNHLNVPAGDLYVTYNAGESWQRHNAQFSFYGVSGLSVLPGRVFAGTDQLGLYVTSGDVRSGVYSKILRAAHVRDVVADDSGQNLWVALRGVGVFRSTDGGATFFPSSNGIHAFSVRDLSVHGSTIVAAVEGGVLRSVDGGRSVQWANAGLGTGDSFAVDMLAVAAAADGRLYASSLHDGFYVSDNGGASWVKRNPGDGQHVRAIAVGANRDNVYAGSFRGRVYVSHNAGASWSTLDVGDSQAFVSSLSPNPANPAALLVSSFNEGTFVTPNASTFSFVQQPTSAEHRFVTHEVLTLPAVNLQVAATSEGILTRPISYTAAPAWTRRLNGVVDSYFTAVVAHPQNPAKLVAAAYGSGLYVSNDAGGSWTKVGLALKSTRIQCLEALDGASFLAGTAGDGVYVLPWP